MNVRAAREFVAGALEEQGFDGDSDVVLLLASELVTNAVRHAATPFEITVDVEDGGVRVAVIDGDVEHAPRVRHPGPEDTNGRGLLLVDQLVGGVGQRPRRPRQVGVVHPRLTARVRRGLASSLP